MEEYSKRLIYYLGYFLMVLYGVVDSQVSPANSEGSSNHSSVTENPNHNRAYFNESLASSVTLPTVLDMKKHIAFSFRTCSYGRLVNQIGGGGDFLNLALTPNGSLEMSSLKADQNKSDIVLIGNNSLRNNQWYTVDIKFVTGEIHLTIETGSQMLHQILVSNDTYNRQLWDLDLSKGTDLQVGSGFSGCIQGGPSITLTGETVIDKDLIWGECPLESQQTAGCGAPAYNPCWRYPCQNGGTCANTGGDYMCTCPMPYSGRNCEADHGEAACDLLPCTNGGTCESHTEGTRKYKCQCNPGYTGVNCEIDIDECAPKPCRNGGLCTDQVNGFVCNCTGKGYQGELCDENINECEELSPCQNGAKCMDTPGNYKCECPKGFAGDNCEDGLNECESSPCRNSGTCSDFLGYYTCECPVGFTGINCEVNIDDCLGVLCEVASTVCVDGINTHSCLCQLGYIDPSGREGNAEGCMEVDECQSSPCENGATCLDQIDQFSCSCPPGYAGAQCEVEINECDSQPCQNGASCDDIIAGFMCTCVPGYTDPQCSTNINECDSSPCQHQAICNDQMNGYNCTCAGGWTGQHCEVPINECLSLPCQNGGICTDMENEYSCECLEGFEGVSCETDINECLVEPCENDASCIDGIGTYTCECLQNWMGQNCTEVYDACSFKPCLNNGTCNSTQPSHDYVCTCLPGFQGDNCQVNIDDCVGHTCLPHQVCVDGVNDYSCDCPKGYAGEKCAVEIDECASSPCQNGGTCVDTIGSYSCDCVGSMVNLTEYTRDARSVFRIGFEGDNCEIEIDECLYRPHICVNDGICSPDDKSLYGFKCFCPSGGEYYTGKYCHIRKDFCGIHEVPDPPLCQNGGTCQDIGDDYSCTCAAGFTGPRCKINIDECESSPCLFNSTCVDGINGYTCSCPAGLTGIHCETNIDECKSLPCQNGGRCDDVINGYLCNCSDTGYTGTHCQTNIDECQSTPCQNQGTCIDKVKGYSCACHTGYQGLQCEVDVDECASNPCQNDATCWQRSNSSKMEFDILRAYGYDCQCVPGFTGAHCEINVNECESNPCRNGNCVDRINSYECNCNAGWTGINCDTEIDECLLLEPCYNGATCTDKLNDYTCTCLPEYNNKQYGGKNCSTELIGCGNNGCQNQATCIPYLVEVTQTHDYTCTCPTGFNGKLCESVTTASFYGNSWLKFDGTDGKADVTMTVRFRTTLPNGLLLINVGRGDEEHMILQLVNSTSVQVVYNNALTSTQDTISTPSEAMLNDGTWQHLTAVVNYQSVKMTLDHPDCPAGGCLLTVPISLEKDQAKHHTLGVTYFGALDPAVGGDNFPIVSPYTGCFEDLQIDNDHILPKDYIGNDELSHNIVEGCPRTEQCTPDPCNSRGECTDLWHTFQCLCQRPFYGVACEDNYTAATFGHDDKPSYAQYNIPDQQLESLKNFNDITLFFRTRKANGLLFYLGGDEGGPAENQTFLSTDLLESSIRTRVKLSDSIQTFMFDGKFDDGRQHFLYVKRKNEMLQVMVNKALKDFTVNAVYPLHPEHLYVGGLPTSTLTRRKRQAEDPKVEMPIEGELYKGTIQDVRQNGHLMPFFAMNDTEGHPPAYDPPLLHNVMEGEVSDDVCNKTQPCVNNGTCQNVFFNDFECSCPEGYRGKDCSELDFCMYVSCPVAAECNNLEDGYECVAPATFDGKDTQFEYSHSLNTSRTINTISMKLRSRQRGGSILRIEGFDGSNYVSLALSSAGELICSYNLGEESQVSSEPDTSDMLDGEWHDILLTIDQTTVTMMVDKSQYISYSTQSMSIGDLLNKGKVQLGNSGTDSFKGCLDDTRIGGVLLPFFSRQEIRNNTAAEQFYVSHMVNNQIGCVGDPVCERHECENGATCQDIWNAYLCDCPLGFNGSLCENNIDDCVGHDCQNGATCQDGIANFTCDCVPGYTGQKCEADVNECENVTCQNNGTCIDGVNSYTCNCTENFVGDLCEIDLRENCDYDPCLNNATCVPVNTSYPGVVTFNCSCVPGFTGVKCESEIDYCEGLPCQNNATCVSDRTILNYTCNCPKGYDGYDCEHEIDECSSQPCQNNATCIDHIGEYECKCDGGWEGVNCENDINECNMTVINGSLPCENNGVCVNYDGGYYCNCTNTGYKGERCEIEIDECESFPCLNGANCTNLPGDYECDCTIGYIGKNCETPDCNASQCQNGATCQISNAVWQCQCPKYVEGIQCEIRGACVDEPCQNEAVCSQGGEDYQNYTCQCTSGWTGENCTQDINECDDPANCENGNCTNTDGSYTCTCHEGFTGGACETEIDYCQSLPCQNGGLCENIPGGPGYTCDCTGTGYNGTDCEVNINECLSNPCKNGGTCIDKDPFFECQCTSDYLGDQCQLVNPCNSSSACLNDGTCTPKVNDNQTNTSWTCNCTEEWEGDRCGQQIGATYAPSQNLIPLVVGIVVAGFIVICVIVVIVLVITARNKRATRGTYSPSRQEMSGSRVEMGNVLKPPPEERLI